MPSILQSLSRKIKSTGSSIKSRSYIVESVTEMKRGEKQSREPWDNQGRSLVSLGLEE